VPYSWFSAQKNKKFERIYVYNLPPIRCGSAALDLEYKVATNQKSQITNPKLLAPVLCAEKKGIISLIGGGGKTTLMFRLAKELAEAGKKVLTTTTTNIMLPDKSLSPTTLLADSTEDLILKSEAALKQYSHFSAASHYNGETGKLKGLAPNTIDELAQSKLFDYIIVEADGARQKPLKATDSHEPVLPGLTSILILLAGLDALGQALDEEYVHRAQIISRNTGLELSALIDEGTVFRILKTELEKAASLCNAKEYIVFLNKADTGESLQSAMFISKMLENDSLADKILIAARLNFFDKGFPTK
jgi:probable selenium-dependent hydroxylase accessory protein YqeC